MRTELEVWMDENNVEYYRKVYDWYIVDGLLWVETKDEVITYVMDNIYKLVHKK